MTWTIRLPWPDRDLWPNGRPNRWTRARKVKKARADGFIAALAAKVQYGHSGPYTLRITAFPKLRPQGGASGFDDDGIKGALKAHRDGIAKAMGIDDRAFTWAEHVEKREAVPYGQIIITVEAQDGVGQ